MKKLFSAFLFLLTLCGASFAQGKEEELLGPEKWPTTVSATVADLLSTLSAADKQAIRNTSKDDLVRYHRGWGTGIRNQYGLWRGNQALIEDACHKPCHPDTASNRIIEAVWQALQDEG